MIIFLTDGHAPYDSARITAENTLGIAIYSIAFSSAANFALLQQISQDADSFATQIFDGDNAALSLEGFYTQISSPLITDLTFSAFESQNGNVNANPAQGNALHSLSNTYMKTFFNGGQFVLSGQLKRTYGNETVLAIKVQGKIRDGTYERSIYICLWNSGPNSPSLSLPNEVCIHPREIVTTRNTNTTNATDNTDTTLQNIYAYIKIQQLILEGTAASEAEALQLALDNGFVTELTSLVMERPMHRNAYAIDDNKQGMDEGDFKDSKIESVVDSDKSGELSPLCEGNVTMYTETHMRGASLFVSADFLTSLPNFDNMAVSVEVEGNCCWKLYESQNFQGNSKVVSSDHEYKRWTSLFPVTLDVSSVKKEICF